MYRETELKQEMKRKDLIGEKMKESVIQRKVKVNRKGPITSRGCMYSLVFQGMFLCLCVCSCGRAKGGESRGGPLWVFVWLRLSSSLGKWKLNTPLQRSGYQVREEERKGKNRAGERGRESCIGVERGTEKERRGRKRP